MSLQPVSALPTTEQEIFSEATRLRAMRRNGMTWREISEATAYTRTEAIRLVHGESQLLSEVAFQRYSDLNYRQPQL